MKGNPKFYPRWIKRPDGADIIVDDHHQHSAHMGQPFNENAEPIEVPIAPAPKPTVAAQSDTALTSASMFDAGVQESDFSEPFYPPAVKQEDPETPFDLDTPINLDPLGIFEPADVTGPAPRRGRKKKAEIGA